MYKEIELYKGDIISKAGSMNETIYVIAGQQQFVEMGLVTVIEPSGQDTQWGYKDIFVEFSIAAGYVFFFFFYVSLCLCKCVCMCMFVSFFF